MAALTEPEMTPGLNVFLDPAVLKGCEGVRSNAGPERPANRPGPFLVIEVNSEVEECLCVPLFSHEGPGREPLDQSLKSGPGKGWISRESFFQTLQFWIIPFHCLIKASHVEMNAVGNRQRYADRSPEALASIAVHRDASDIPYEPF